MIFSTKKEYVRLTFSGVGHPKFSILDSPKSANALIKSVAPFFSDEILSEILSFNNLSKAIKLLLPEPFEPINIFNLSLNFSPFTNSTFLYL